MKIDKLKEKLKGLEGAIFDVDGTLLDSMKAWDDVDYTYLASFGIYPPPGLQKIFFAMTMDESTAYIKENYLPDLSPQEIAEGIFDIIRSFYRDEALLKPGMEELLDFLREQGTKMVVVSSSERDLIESSFERLGIMSYFEAIYTCTEFGASKAKPDIFEYAANKMGLSNDKVMVFEDGLYAIEVVKSAGFPAVGFYDQSSDADWEEIKAKADYYLDKEIQEN